MPKHHYIRNLIQSLLLLLVLAVGLALPAHSQSISLSSPSQSVVPLGFTSLPISLSGGNGSFGVAVLSGNLPTGVTLRSSSFPPGWNSATSPWCLCGVAIAAGRYNFTLRITSGAATLDQAFTVDVSGAIDPNGTALPDAVSNVAYSHQLRSASTGNSPSFVWTLAPGAVLPPGLSLSSGGVISGTPTVPNNYTFATQLSDGGFGFTRVTHSITVRAYPIVTAATLPVATQGTLYSTSITAGAPATNPIQWNVVAGSLPTGLTLAAGTGIVSGTPTVAGTFRFTVQSRDANFRLNQRVFALQVLSTPTTLISYTGEPFAQLANATIGAYRLIDITASHGVAPYTFQLRSGSQLPTGMSLLTGATLPNANTSSPLGAAIAGVPASPGSYTFTIDITDSSPTPVTTSKTYTLQVVGLFSQTNPTNASQNQSYSFTINPFGGVGPYSIAYPVGFTPGVFTGQVRLPAGMSLNPATGVLSGTPTESGTFYLPVEITDSAANSLRQSIVLNVLSNATANLGFCSNSTLPSATTGVAYSLPICLGIASSYTATIVSGSAPPGLSFNSSAVLAGIPSTPGIYTFRVTFGDAGNANRFVTAQLTISVQNNQTAISSTLPEATIGTSYSTTLSVAGPDPVTQISVEPDSILPPGITLNSGSGILAGLPGVVGRYAFNVRFTSAVGYLVQPFTLNVNPPPSNGTTTVPTAAAVSFNSSAQSANLAATVSSLSGTVNAGTVTFTLKEANGNIIGAPVVSPTVAGGAASVVYPIPAGLGAAVYSIEAVYSGGGPFLGSTGIGQFSINPAAVSIAASSAGAAFSANTQAITLTATLSSVGPVNGGTVSFTVRNSSNAIVGASVVSGIVSGGSATAAFTLPAAVPTGTYIIEAAYSGAANFAGATGSGSFAITAAATSVSATTPDASFSANQQTIAINVAVSSVAGTVNGGSPSVTVRDAANQVVGTPLNVAAVNAGNAVVTYNLPAGAATGAYSIQVAYPGAGNFAASNGSGSFNINASPTSTSAAQATAVFSSGAQTIALVATVTGNGGAVNGGTITFTVRDAASNVVGAPVVSAIVTNNNASVNYPWPAAQSAGAYTIEAAYSGAPNFGASTGTGSLTITGLTSTTTVSAQSINFSSGSQVIMLSATVTEAANPVNGGTVSFEVRNASNAAIAAAMVSAPVANNAASVSFTVPAGQSQGTYTIVAVYSGSTNFSPSNGANSLTIVGASSSITVGALNASYASAAQSLTFSGTVSSPAGTVNAGTLTFVLRDSLNNQVGATVVATVASGTASGAYVLPAATPAGNYTLGVSYSGGGNFSGSTATGVLAIAPAATTTTVNAVTTPLSISTNVVTLAANVSSVAGSVNSGTVTFTLRDAGNNVVGNPQTTATGTVGGGFASTAWVIPANQATGAYTIQASYSSAGNFAASNGAGTLTISAVSTVVNATNASRAFTSTATPVTLLATVTSGLGVVNSGTVTFAIRDAGNAIIGAPTVSPTVANNGAAVSYALPAALAAGTYSISANYSGGGGFAANSGTAVLTIGNAATTTAATPIVATYSSADQNLALSATVASTAGTVSAGSITFSLRNSANAVVLTPVVAPLGANGTATASMLLPGGFLPGSYSIQAAYSGGGNFNGSSGAAAFTLNGLPTTTTNAAASTAWSPAQQSVSFSAVVASPGGPVNGGVVQFTLRDSINNIVGSPTGSLPVVNNAASVSFLIPAGTPPGSYTIQAAYLGSDVFGVSSSTATLTIVGAATTTSLNATASPIALGAVATLTATVSPFAASGRVVFYDGVAILGTSPLVAGNATLTTRLLAAGAHALRAQYLGDATYSPSSSGIQSRTVATGLAGDFLAAPGSPFAAGSAPTAIAQADFNSDGVTDIAALSSSGLYLLLGNGSGGLATTIGPIAVGAFPSALAVGDINGDGFVDAAVANFGSNNLSILPGNGSGGFGAATTIAAGSGPNAIALADFNSDGLLDLVASNQDSNNLTYLRGNGTGGFSAFAVAPNVGTRPIALLVTDLNNDGRADLVVANSNSNSLSVFTGSGDGTFVVQPTLSTGTNPSAVTAADLNGDQIPDLAVTNRNANSITIYLGNGAGGFATAPSSPVAVNSSPASVAAGDFDGDGTLDLAYSSTNGIATLKGQGTGAFVARQSTAATNASMVVAMEANNDGIADIAFVTPAGIQVILGRTAPTSTAPATVNTAFSASAQSIALTANVSSASGVVNGGTIQFTVRDSANSVVGSPVTSGAVANGSGAANFVAPASLAAGTYSIQAVYSGGGVFASSTGTSSLVIASPSTFIVTSIPTGLSIVVDGVTVTTPATFTNWAAGSSHTLSAPINPGATAGTRFAFTSWSQGGLQSQTITAPASGTTYTATYRTQYELTSTVSGNGTLVPGPGWFDANAIVSVTATPDAGNVFSGYSGDLTGTTPSQNLTMSAPRNVIASFAVANPVLGATVQSRVNGTLTNERVWTLNISNTGNAPAANVQIVNALIETTSGPATVTLSPNSVLPLGVGAIANGGSGTVPIRLIFPLTSPLSRIRLTLTVTPDGGATFQTIILSNQLR